MAGDLEIPGERSKRFSVICERTVGVSPSFDTPEEALQQYGEYRKTWGDKVKITVLDKRQEIHVAKLRELRDKVSKK